MISRALILVDLQSDFCEGGSLAVAGGAAVAKRAGDFARHGSNDLYNLIVFSRDWHVDPGTHWVQEGETPNFIDTWPVHCAADTPGAELHPNVGRLPTRAVEVKKGMYKPAYSAFEGVTVEGWPLDGLLDRCGIDAVDVCGIELANCVKATTQSSIDLGYPTRMITDLVAYLNGDTAQAVYDSLNAEKVDRLSA